MSIIIRLHHVILVLCKLDKRVDATQYIKCECKTNINETKGTKINQLTRAHTHTHTRTTQEYTYQVISIRVLCAMPKINLNIYNFI